MIEPNPQALDFLLTRRSRPTKTLGSPCPSPEQLLPMLTAAARVPDHGKLEPWRFIVLSGDALVRLGDAAGRRARSIGRSEEDAAKAALLFTGAPLIVAVIASPKASEKIPPIEQTLSAGACCLGLVNAALASGWGAGWVSGFTAMDREFLTQQLGLADAEYVAGYVVIGTESATPPDRPRPDIGAITTWITE